MNTISLVLVVHFIADFVLQSRWMGQHKSKNIRALLLHILVYWFALLIFFGFKYAMINAILHMLVDYYSSRCSGFFYKKDDMYKFWIVIGADQMLHSLCLINTINLIK